VLIVWSGCVYINMKNDLRPKWNQYWVQMDTGCESSKILFILLWQKRNVSYSKVRELNLKLLWLTAEQNQR